MVTAKDLYTKQNEKKSRKLLYFRKVIKFTYSLALQRLPLTRALKGFFLQVQTCVLVDVNQPLPWFFTRWSRADSFPVSRALGRTCLRLSPFCNIFATESGTASRPDYEEYEFVECLSEETQIIDLFTHSKLQPHKFSQCTLAARLSSC